MKIFAHRKRFIWAILLCLSVILFPLLSQAVTVHELPNPRQLYGGWVSDGADMLSDSTEAQLNAMISELERQNGSEIAVVTVPGTAPAPSPKAFATELFNTWGIGKQGQDNGVLFLISKSDRRVEIETGSGLQTIIPDAEVKRIIDNKITPKFKQGDFDGGTLAGTKALVNTLQGQPLGFVFFCYVAGVVLFLSTYFKARQEARHPLLLEPYGRSRINSLNDTSLKKIHQLLYFSSFGVTFTLTLLAVSSIPNPWAYIVVSIGIVVLTTLNKQSSNSNSASSMVGWVVGWSLLLIFVIFIIVPILANVLIAVYSFAGQTGLNLAIAFLAGVIAAFPLANLLMKLFVNLRTTRCIHCQMPMEQTDSTLLASHLSRPEKVAQDLGSVKFEGWQCPSCSPKIQRQGIHIRTYVLDSALFSNCPTCQELTVTFEDKVLKRATEYTTGKRLVTNLCKCCNYRHEQEQIIPLLSSCSRSSSSSSDGSCSSSSTSSNSGDFGGGSSGGGGAGGDW
ncbi:MAG: TPM domain-containing protein [Cyanobacteriota bacterium]